MLFRSRATARGEVWWKPLPNSIGMQLRPHRRRLRVEGMEVHLRGLPPNHPHAFRGGSSAMLEITTDPLRPGSRISARRKNGDKIFLYGETIRQLKTARKVLMKLSKHFDLPLATFTDFVGLEMINASNYELIECLSSVPDPYAPVDLRAAMVASSRDFKIVNRILSRPRQSTIEQLL